MKRQRICNFEKSFPQLVQQWHPHRNSDIALAEISPSDNLSVWWRCGQGHEWVALVSERCEGAGCPQCGPVSLPVAVPKELAANFPVVAALWHPTKNIRVTSEFLRFYPHEKVWWLCERGHVWHASVGKVKLHPYCRRCHQKNVTAQYNLAAVHPEIKEQWHPYKNGQLKPEEVTPSAAKVVWWLCKNGHEWSSQVNHRTRNLMGCPYCSQRKANQENNLAVLHPELARFWHPEKNGSLTPAQVTPRFTLQVWWLCHQKHQWQAPIQKFVKDRQCPQCYQLNKAEKKSLLIDNPRLCEQWHPTKNGALTPADFTPHSFVKVWWLCEKGHEYEASPGNRNRRIHGRGCPYCAGYRVIPSESLEIMRPDLLAQWHPTKNGIMKSSSKQYFAPIPVWWQCPKGHQWREKICHRALKPDGIDCPICTGRAVER